MVKNIRQFFSSVSIEPSYLIRIAIRSASSKYISQI